MTQNYVWGTLKVDKCTLFCKYSKLYIKMVVLIFLLRFYCEVSFGNLLTNQFRYNESNAL